MPSKSICLLLLVLLMPGAARGAAETKRETVDVSLAALMANPEAYAGQRVRFACRLARRGNLFRHDATIFSPARHRNYAVWPLEAALWKASERARLMSTLYLGRLDAELTAVMDKVERSYRLNPLRVTGEVVSAYAKLPWIRAEKVEILDETAAPIAVKQLCLLLAAERCLADGEREQAAAIYRDALAAGLPDEAAAHARMRLSARGNSKTSTASEASVLKGDTEAARKAATEAVDEAREAVRARRYADAVRAYMRAIHPDSPLAEAAWLRLEIGEVYESRYDETGRVDLLATAEREYEKAMQVTGGQDAPALALLARIYFKREWLSGSEDYPKTRRTLARCFALHPERPEAKLTLARVLSAMKKPEKAHETLVALMGRFAQRAEFWLALGEAYGGVGNSDQEYQAYAKAVELAPFHRAVLEKHMRLAQRRKDWRSARQSAEALVARYPDEARYRLALGEILLARGRLQRAAACLIRAEQAPGYVGEQAGVALAQAYLRLKRPEGARRAAYAVLQRAPGNVAAQAVLAMLDLQTDPPGTIPESPMAMQGKPSQWNEVRGADDSARIRIIAPVYEMEAMHKPVAVETELEPTPASESVPPLAETLSDITQNEGVDAAEEDEDATNAEESRRLEEELTRVEEKPSAESDPFGEELAAVMLDLSLPVAMPQNKPDAAKAEKAAEKVMLPEDGPELEAGSLPLEALTFETPVAKKNETPLAKDLPAACSEIMIREIPARDSTLPAPESEAGSVTPDAESDSTVVDQDEAGADRPVSQPEKTNGDLPAWAQ